MLLFQRRRDAETMPAALAELLAKFGLHLHEDKTRLIEFGRFAEENSRRKGGRMVRELKELRQELRRRMHQRLHDQHRWLAAVLRGHYAYFGIPGNSTYLGRFRLQVMKAWRRGLLRRSQRPKLSWERFNAILKVYPILIGHVRDWRYQVGRIK